MKTRFFSLFKSVRRLLGTLCVALSMLAVSAGVTSTAAIAQVPIIYAYDFSGARLVSFAASAPGTLLSNVNLTGLGAGEFLLGIDFRPANGQLYGLVFESASIGRLVTIDKSTGGVTSVGPNPVVIGGSFYGVSFDPASDQLRAVSNFDLNIRISPAGGTGSTDTTLAFAAGDPNFGVNPSVVHLAHTNAFAGATTTTTYGIDAATDSLVRIGGVNATPSPNGGQLTTIGSLGVAANLIGGFDIEPASNVGYAVLGIGSASVLHSINLATGAATAIGTVGLSSGNVDGVAIAPTNRCLDLDGDGVSRASTDGLMLIRALLGMTGTSVTAGAIASPAPPRSTWSAIRSHLQLNCEMYFSP